MAIFLIFLTFFQASILPVNLALVFILALAFVKSDRVTLYLAFFLGLLESHLRGEIMGLGSLIYLGMVVVIYLLRGVVWSFGWLSSLLFGVVLLWVRGWLEGLIGRTTLSGPVFGVEVGIFGLIYLLVRFYQRHLVKVSGGIKLKDNR